MSTLDEELALSPELTDLIIDYLYDDKPSLSYCSLVCHAWTPRAQFNLFRVLSINADDPTRRFYRYYAWLDRNPGIAYCVQELHLHGNNMAKRPSFVMPYILHSLISRMPSLHTVRLVEITLYTNTTTEGIPQWMPPVPQTFPEEPWNPVPRPLRKLIFEQPDVGGDQLLEISRISTFTQFLRLFSDVGELEVFASNTRSIEYSNTTPPYADIPSLLDLPSHFHLKTLRLSRLTDHDICLIGCLQNVPLTTLYLHYGAPDRTDDLQTFVTKTGGNLSSMYLSAFTTPFNHCVRLDLTACSSLQSIDMSLSEPFGEPQSTPADIRHRPVLATLSTAPQSIVHLSFSIPVNPFATRRDIPVSFNNDMTPFWKELMRPGLLDRMRCLKKLSVSVDLSLCTRQRVPAISQDERKKFEDDVKTYLASFTGLSFHWSDEHQQIGVP